jgi:hypothetical protein
VVAGVMAAMRRGRRAVCRSVREASGGAAAVDRVSVLPGMMCSMACVAEEENGGCGSVWRCPVAGVSSVWCCGEEARRVAPRKKTVAAAACGRARGAVRWPQVLKKEATMFARR